ncbi:triose-phosphate isomerase [Azotobacter chroococcum]|uniref:Triosephosphate isomerase n=2 Tax=Azotobacter chroococcum TaxID=353 RepID=A0A0C4WL33_9GAMM|nr:triose-phosphate isomerase [Azotobacter chroococcum]AJE19775.1 Triosephosphate isomerase (TIM) [Azotobacter chroococcum NCIMB 8003]TBV94045.1 triose-phosphate isomerase [Azotobacter chroococcum]TBW07218.1 triose-phosphate isomerase [Azotobacter chroococcum]TBW32380.1 triose-phosphate isomerase [Azotobacter chroococcum]TCL18661.1 triosephosphate isomerase [Azotobacter chroococcum]
MRGKLVIGNWKMNGSLEANRCLLQELLPPLAALKGVGVAVCPPFPYLAQVAGLLEGSGVALGAQNLNAAEKGAFTGEVAGGMLGELGCRYVLVGHSERRSLYGESDELVAEKFEAALAAGLVPVLCVGETLAQRRDGSTEAVIAAQVRAVLQRVGSAGIAAAVVAYEPVWAIGTGETATPEQAQAVHRHIRALLGEADGALAAATPILYGGSVKADNAAALFAQPDIDGGLIGGASLEAASFLAICQAAR